MLIGAQMAIRDINDAGGVRIGTSHAKLSLTVKDDRCDARRATSVAQEMIQSGVSLVLGHVCTGSSIAAAKIYAAAGIVQIAPLNRHARLTDKRAGPTLFRLAGRDDRQGFIAGTFLAATYRDVPIAVVHDRTLAAMSVANGVIGALKSWRHRKLFLATMRPGEKDYATLVARLMKSKAAAIHITSYPTETAILTRQLAEAGSPAQIMSSELIRSPDYLALAGDAGNSSLLTLPPQAGDFPSARPLIMRLRAAQAPDLIKAAQGYAAIQIWSAAVKTATSAQGLPVAAVLSARSFDTVLGRLAFNAQGDSNLPSYRIYRRSGAPLPMQPDLTGPQTISKNDSN